MSFNLCRDVEALVQECLDLHEKHMVLKGCDKSKHSKTLLHELAKQSSAALQQQLSDLLTYRHSEKTLSNRHQGFGWSSEIIRQRFTAGVQKEVEGIYAEILKHRDTH